MENIYKKDYFPKNKVTEDDYKSSTMREEIQKRFVEMFIFCIPLVKFFEIQIIGRLFATDIIVMVIFPLILITKYNRLLNRNASLLILLAILWLCNQILTDFIRNIDSVDYYRGWAKICFTIIHFITLYLLIYDHKRRIVVFALGLSFGNILEYFFNPNLYAFDYPWKFGIGYPITLAIVVIASAIYNKSFLLCLILIGVACIINLLMDFRSLSGVCFLTAIYLLIQYSLLSKSKYQSNLSIKQLLLIGLFLMMACVTFFKSYENLASIGFLGDKAQEKYILQSSGDFGILLGGRSEILVASRAILSSPIIGYGSWAKDYRFAELLNDLMHSLGYPIIYSNEMELIPTHSHFFGAWVEAGLFGAIFWGFIVTLITKFLKRTYENSKDLNPLSLFIAFLLLWDIFFSPFGADQRFTKPFYFIALITFLPEKSKDRYYTRIHELKYQASNHI